MNDRKLDRLGLEGALGKRSHIPAPLVGSVPQQRPPSRQGKVGLVSHHDPAVAQQLKVLAATEGTTQQFLLAEALNLLFSDRDLPQIADTGPRTRRAHR